VTLAAPTLLDADSVIVRHLPPAGPKSPDWMPLEATAPARIGESRHSWARDPQAAHPSCHEAREPSAAPKCVTAR
jgi:hypothetical protein